MTSLYICYSSLDSSSLDALFEKLRKAHYQLLPQQPGQSSDAAWRKAMKAGIRACDQVLLVFSENAFQSAKFAVTVAYAHKLERQMVCYDPNYAITHERLQELGLRSNELRRIDPDEVWARGIRGLLPSTSPPLTREGNIFQGSSEKSRWLAYVTEQLQRSKLSQTQFIRQSNEFLEVYHRPTEKAATNNLFDYTRGTPFPIIQLVAFIRTFKSWSSDYTLANAVEFLRLSKLDDDDIARILPKLIDAFPEHVQINPDFPDMAAPFLAREVELDDLHELLVVQGRKLLTLKGRPGVGKTELTKQAINRLRGHFDLVYWKELRTPITAESFIDQFMSFAAPEQRYAARESAFLDVLRDRRCLIVLDQFETLLDHGNHYDKYLSAYVGFDWLLQNIATAQHRSCLLITTTYTPTTLSEDLAVRYANAVSDYCVNGIDISYTHALAEDAGIHIAEDDLSRLHRHFDGHPLSIRSAIQKIASGQYATIADYLKRATLMGDRVKETVEELQYRSSFALDVLYWLGVEREYTTVERLRDLMGDGLPEVDSALRLLMNSFLIERHPTAAHTYRLRSEALNYINERLIGQISRALYHEDIPTLLMHGLKLAGSKDYIHDAQTTLLVVPVAERLLNRLGAFQAAQHLRSVLLRLQSKEWEKQRGFAAANVLHVMTALNIPFDGWDFSNTYLREVDLRHTTLHNVNFSGVILEKCRFMEDVASGLSLAFDRTGQYMIAGTTDGRIHLWDLEQGGQKWATDGTQVWLDTLTFNADGSRVISGDSHGSLKLWDATDGRCLGEYEGQSERGRLYQLAITTDDKIATVGDDGLVRLWQVGAYNIRLIWEAGPFHEGKPEWGRLYNVAFHPGERVLAVVGEQKVVYLLDVATGDVIDVLSGHDSYLWGLAFSPDGRFLATSGEDHTIYLWDLEENVCRAVLRGHTNTPLTLAFTRDGVTLFSGGIDKTICVWDVKTGVLLKRLRGHVRWVRKVAFRPLDGGEQLVSIGDDKAICFWDMQHGEVIGSRRGTQFGARLLVASRDGGLVAVSRDSLAVSIWDMQTGEIRCELDYPFNSWVRAMSFAKDSGILAVAHENHIILFDTTTGKVMDDFPAYPDQEFIWSLDYTPDGNYLICAGGDEPKQIILWNRKHHAKSVIPDPHPRWILQARSSPDGRWVASASDDGSLKIWSVADGTLCCEQTHVYDHAIWMLAFTPDGRLVSATQEPGDSVIVWEVDGEHLRPLVRIYTNHTRKVGALAVTADGQTLVTGGDDGLLQLRNLETGELLSDGILHAHNAPIHTLVAIPGTTLVASGSAEHHIKLWDIPTRAQVGTFEYPRPYEGLNLRGVSGLSDAEKTALESFGAIVD